ncbi:MAG: MoaD/ThiS family protein [Candidatus Korarchaeum sp.]
MRIRFLGKPKEIMGREIELEVGEIRLRDLLERLPREVRDLITDGEKLRMIVLINGVSAESKGGLDALLSPKDELFIMPEISGG